MRKYFFLKKSRFESGDLNENLRGNRFNSLLYCKYLSVPVSLTLRRARTNKERLYRGDLGDTYYRILAQFREQAPRRVFRVSCLVAINFKVCTLRRPAAHMHTHVAVCAPCTCNGVYPLRRYRESSAAQIFRRGSYEDIFKMSSSRVLIISPISISAE